MADRGPGDRARRVSAAPATLRPSVTVVLLRDGEGGLEALLVRRNPQLAHHGGAWVFPGGGIEAVDRRPRAGSEPLGPARQAAVREVAEETGLRLVPEALVPTACWTTPEELPRRYRTWYFAAPGGNDAVRVDHQEIVDYRWLTPAEALTRQGTGRLTLPPPTFVTLHGLVGFPTAAAALQGLEAHGLKEFRPRMWSGAAGVIFFYQDDAGYADLDPRRPGRRHRLQTGRGGWHYQDEGGA
jgi:8-oxo-dGTP pyrophosphatase MutT (NUDIX family)